jgi:hypothetical protein
MGNGVGSPESGLMVPGLEKAVSRNDLILIPMEEERIT